CVFAHVKVRQHRMCVQRVRPHQHVRWLQVAVHNATAVNGAQIRGNGVSGHCLQLLDQLKQGASVADHASLDFGSDTDFSVSIWVKRNGAMTPTPNGEVGDSVIICKQDWSNGNNPGWGIYATSDGGLKWNLAGSSRKTTEIASGASGIADGRWHHVLISSDRSGHARCYVDGNLSKTLDISGAGSVDNSMALAIGIDGNGDYPWKGFVDEVAIWNRALDGTEAREAFEAGKQGIAMSGNSVIDSDGDKMDDAWEMTHFGNLAETAEGDYDSDGRSNFEEYATGGDPNMQRLTAASRVTTELHDGQTYPVLHFIRPAVTGNISYVPESSSDLNTWSSGDAKFIPFAPPTDKGNGLREFHLRYYQSTSAVTAGRVLLRVRMDPRYQGAVSETITPTVELRNGQAIVTWTTATPTATILSYGRNGQTNNRYEDYTLSTYHEVVISNMQANEAFTYTVIQENDGVVTQSKTFTTSGEWDYSAPPVVDQAGYVTPGGWAARAADILASSGVLDRGYCLDYLCGDGRLAFELARQSQIVVIGIEDTQAEVDAARAFLTERGVYGSRVTVVLASDLANLPFPHDFFNLVVSQSQIDSASDFTTFQTAVQKHIIPARGVVAGLDGGNIQVSSKVAHPGTGSWTMSYGNPSNTSSSIEEFSGKTNMDEFELRWLGAPGPELAWDRQVAEQPPLAKNGRFYCQGKGRILALDSHNGSVLWTRELDDAQRFNMLRDAGNLTADEDAVWLSLRKECWKMDGDTGELTVFPLVEGSRTDLEYNWNYICRTGDQLLGSASVPKAFYKEHWGSQFWYTHASGNLASQVCSDNLFSLDASTGAVGWTYEDGLILSVTITVGNGKIYFLETRNATAVAGVSRRLGTATWKQDIRLVCLDLETGAKQWDQPLSMSGGSQTVFLMYDATTDKLILSSGSGSTNYLYGFNPANGAALWNASAACYKTDHGGSNQHPVISNGEIFFTPNVYNPTTGAVLRSNIPMNRGQGCNTYWGSKNMLFYRTGYSGKGLSMWPTAGGAASGVDHVRGGCWLNWAPADGMFLIQEKSAGCSCGAWINISQGWGPKAP
ncbi:MAG: LamG-like jellyroll fold domain-containing protein, partial [Akkermansiaceae bacterium]